MKRLLCLLLPLLASLSAANAATINWSAGINHGFSGSSGTDLPAGALVRIGWFRNAGTGQQLTDSEIQNLASTPATLDASFVEAASSTVGSGFTPPLAAHFAVSSTVNTGSSGLNVVGRQMYLWVLNAASVAAATEQAILYWDITDTATNPDSSPQTPGVRWSFPGQDPVPGSTTVDLTDLTTGTGSLAAGARLLVGTYPTGTSDTTSAANFGLAALATPLQIVTTSPLLPGGVLNTAYSKTLTATGGTGTRTWTVTGGALPNGVTLSTAGLLSGSPLASGDFTFTAQVEDQAAASLTRSFTLNIAASALDIGTPSPLAAGTVGIPYAQAFTATGGTGPYTWAVSAGALPASFNLSSGGGLTGTATNGGTANFTLEATDAAGRTATKAFSLTIQAALLSITTPQALNSPVINLLFSQTLAASGGTAPLTWTLDVGTLPAGITLSTAGVLSGTPTVAGPYSFTIKVTDANSVSATKAFGFSVLDKVIKPVVNTPTFPVTMVSDGAFRYTLTALNYPKTFAATGLPTGLKLNVNTGEITGRPTVSGIFNVQVTAKNAAGTSAAVTAKLVVKALPTNAIGTFVGHITRQSDVNGGLGGRIDLTTGSTGGYTLVITQGAKVTRLVGFLAASASANPQINATSGTLSVALVLAPATNSVGGTVTIGSFSATVSGWRKVWNTASNPASGRTGYYTMGIDLTTDVGNPLVPQGTGYASFLVSIEGALTVSGRTADGISITSAGFVGPDGQVLVHQLLYANKGSLLGELTLTEDPGGSFSDNVISGPLTWSKSETPTLLAYPNAFGPLTLAAYGKYMAWSSRGSIVLGLPDTTTPASLNFAEGGLLASQTDPDVAAFTYTGATVVPMPTSALANPGKATLSITAATGAFSGYITLVETSPALTRRIPYQGMIIRTQSGTSKGFGYFLLPQIPTGNQTIKNSPVKSGQVVISQ